MQVGIIGMGFMGGVHLNAWRSVDTAQVVAVCDANPIGSNAKTGNLDVGTEQLDLDGVSIYTDVTEMLETESLEAVSITLPTHLHKAVSIQVLEAGIHALCEKPMALNIADCDAMIRAADSAGKQLMIAHCIRFWPEYEWAKKIIDSGDYGSVVSADFFRLTHSPAWDSGSWFADQNKSGGLALDLHIHDLDYIQHLFGIPKNIHSTHVKLDNGAPSHIQTGLDYGNDRVVSATASWAMPASFGFQMGYKIILEKAVLCFDSQAEVPLILIPAQGDPNVPQLEEGDAYMAEIHYFARKISHPTDETIITPEQARESVRMALETLK